MKHNIYKIIKKVSILTVLVSNIATAVPWCHQGTIVEIADVSWSGPSIIANFIPNDIPLWVVDNVDNYITQESVWIYANGFVGGGGGFGGYSVPNSGEVLEDIYWPHDFTVSSLYNISEGVKFKLKKCYTIPPLTITQDYISSQPTPTGDGTLPFYEIKYQPFSKIEPVCEYWSTKIVDPDEDEDFNEEDRRNIIEITGGFLSINAAPSNYCRSR